MRPFGNVFAATIAGVVVAVSACGTGEHGEEVGQVELTIVAVDSEGNTWKLPEGTDLYVYAGSFADSLSLDGDAAVQSFSLPAGDYEWDLFNLGVSGPEWPLERIDPQNNVETIMATLVNPQPGVFSIFEGDTTSLTLEFDAAVGGSITFAKGTVDVSVEVETNEVVGGDFQCGGVVEASLADASVGTPPELLSRLPSVGSVFDLTLLGHIDGPWEMTSSDKVCAHVDIDGIGSPHSGVIDILSESSTGTFAAICLHTSGIAEIHAFGSQPPTTATFNDLGLANLSASTLVFAQLPAPAFDGETLDLSILAGAYDVDATFFQTVGDDISFGWNGAYSGQVYFSFTAAP